MECCVMGLGVRVLQEGSGGGEYGKQTQHFIDICKA